MARKRQIDPGIWTSEQFISLEDPWAKLLFIGMFSNADDEGRMKASLMHLKAVIFPGDPHTLEQMKQWRDMVEGQGLCQTYSVNGTEYLWLPTFDVHQYISKPYPSRIPEPFPNHSLTVPQPFHPNGIDNGNGNGNDIVVDNKEECGKVSTFFYGDALGKGIIHEMAIGKGEIQTVAHIWRKVLEDLKGRMTKSNFQTWLNDVLALGVSDTRFILVAKDDYQRDGIIRQLKHIVEKSLKDTTGRLFSLDVVVLEGDPICLYVRETIESMCEDSGVSKVELLRGKRTPEVVATRKKIAKCLSETTTLPLLHIGRHLKLSDGVRKGKGAFDF